MKLTHTGLLRINFRDFLPHEKRRLRCNFNCSYCNQQDVQQIEFSEREFNLAKKVWSRLSALEDHIIVRLNFDGEILVDRWAREIWYHVNSMPNVRICELITNNSIDPDHYTDRLDLTKTSFNCSFHPEFIAIGRFIEHSLKLMEKGCPLFATMVVKPDMVRELAGISARFKEAGILFKPLLLLEATPTRGTWQRLIIKASRGIFTTGPYRLHELREIRRHYYSDEEFQFQNGRKTRGMLCSAGIDMVNVFLDGSVMRCFGSRLGSVDELCDGAIQLRKEPYPCFAATCQCPTHMIFLQEFRDRYRLSDVFADHYETG